MRYEVNEGLNVVERWNGANDFICYGRQGIFATDSREQQEVSTLCLQLLQNCLMLINRDYQDLLESHVSGAFPWGTIL